MRRQARLALRNSPAFTISSANATSAVVKMLFEPPAASMSLIATASQNGHALCQGNAALPAIMS